MYSQNDVLFLYLCTLIQSFKETMSNSDIHQPYLKGSLKVAMRQSEEVADLLQEWLTQPGDNAHAASEIDRIARRLGVSESHRNSLAWYRWNVLGQRNAPREFALLITPSDSHLFDPREASASSGNVVFTAAATQKSRSSSSEHMSWFITTGPVDYTTEHRIVEATGQEAVTWLADHLPIPLFKRRAEQTDFVKRYVELHPTNPIVDMQESFRLHKDALRILKQAKEAVRLYRSSPAQDEVV